MRRTPIIALILAPFVLWAVVMAFSRVLLPLGAKTWYSEVSVRARMAIGITPIRLQALHDAAGVREPGAALIDLLVEAARSDPARYVRMQAWGSLGAIGHRQALPADGVQVLGDAVLAESEADPLLAAIEAAGQAAAHNRMPEAVVLRLADLSDDKRRAWLTQRAIEALARIGAAQPLPDAVTTRLGDAFTDPRRRGQREDLARAFRTIAEGGGQLPVAILDALAAALAADERNYRIRVNAVYAIAYSKDHYPQAGTLLDAAARDPQRDVQGAAAHALRIIAARTLYAGREAMAVALDRSLPVEDRLKAMGPLKVNRRDAEWRANVIALARDPDPRIVIAALDLFKYISGSPEDRFDRESLIPQLDAAMQHAEPWVRRTATVALGSELRPQGRYRSHAEEFRPRLEAGARDPDPRVRIAALATLVDIAPGSDERAALLERALTDADPLVRANFVGWLGTPRTEFAQRDALLARALADPDPNVRRAAEAAQKTWVTRERSWPAEAWKLWQAGEHEKLGIRALIAVTVAAPVIVGLAFLLYFVARLLTYLYQRRWRALAVLAVMAAWAAAGYGMFMLYFMAAHMGSNLDFVKALKVAGFLWGAVALYAGLGWGLHYAVRR
jgi:HEAT repeat protein